MKPILIFELLKSLQELAVDLLKSFTVSVIFLFRLLIFVEFDY